jgi:enoyl-CoA hydratase/carnithine racemase
LANVHLDRPQEHNRITSTMMSQLVDALAGVAGSGADVLTITAAGADFSLGRDQGERPPNLTRAQNTRLIVEANRALAAFPGIAVAAVRGRALGFACGLAVQADITIAAADATLGFDEVHTARPPKFVMSYLADYIGPKRAMDMVVTGRMLTATEAERFGIVSRVVAEQQLEAALATLVSGLLALDHEALRTCKQYPHEIRSVEPARRDEYAYARTIGNA